MGISLVPELWRSLIGSLELNRRGMKTVADGSVWHRWRWYRTGAVAPPISGHYGSPMYEIGLC